MEAEETTTQKVPLSKRLKGVLLIALILFSSFLFMTAFVLKISRAATTIYEVQNVIYINATGVSASATGQEPSYQTLKIVVGKQTDVQGKIQTLDYNETEDTGDTTFTYTSSEQYYMFKDLTNFDDPYYYVGNIPITPEADKYVGYRFANGTTMLVNASTWKHYFPIGTIGASVQERTLYFNSPQTYAQAYCSRNGYSYLNVINSTYEEHINYNALNTYRSRFLESRMVILDSESQTLNSSSNMHQESLSALAIIGVVIFSFFAGGIITNLLHDIFSPDTNYEIGADEPPEAPKGGEPPSDNITLGLINLTQHAIDRFGESVDIALAAFINGSISFEQYMAIVDKLGSWYFGAVNATVVNIQEIYNRYYNYSEAAYDKYTKAYDSYAASFQASWTDWLTTIIILVIVIVVIVIVYKFITRKGISQKDMPVCPFIIANN